MNYQWHYDHLIETRKNRILNDDTYTENHHIIMRSMGGIHDKINMIRLTAREHFIAHWLLWRIYRNKQTANAFFSMCKYISSKTSIRKKIYSSRAFKEAREAWSIKCKEQWGCMTPEKKKSICEKMSAAKLGKPAHNKGIKGVSEETKRRMSESAKSRGYIPMSNETKEKIAKSRRGKHLSEETRKKLSDINKKKHIKNKQKTCTTQDFVIMDIIT